MNAEDLKPGSRIGEYSLVEKIGAGGFGTVWKAVHHVWSDRVVAVKIPTHPGLIDQLRNEAEIQHDLEKLDDVHIVRTIGLDTSHEPPYFVMEYVEGDSLRDILAKRERIDLDTVLDWCEQILKALVHAHSADIVHRDLKPENVLVTPDRTLKLMDFGLGYKAAAAEASILLSGELDEDSARAAGTLEYMAPEVRQGETPGTAADVYAFGIILFELLTNERPQPGDKPSDLNPACPRRLDDIFARCYARIEKRYGSAAEVLTQLRRLQAAPTRAIKVDEIRRSQEKAPRPEAPVGMSAIPGGKFRMGFGDAGDDRAPAQTRFVEPFLIGTYPVTNAEFLKFIRDGGYEKRDLWDEAWDGIEKFRDRTGQPGPAEWAKGSYPGGRDRHPVVGVAYPEARAYARWAGARLPAEPEWEKAARGETDHAYPWGPDFDAKRCNTKESGIGGTTVVQRYRKGESPYGVRDLAGNVLEWTVDFYGPYPGNEENNPYFGEFYRVLRGGCWYFNARAAEVWVRHYLRPDLRLDYVGFRIARNI